MPARGVAHQHESWFHLVKITPFDILNFTFCVISFRFGSWMELCIGLKNQLPSITQLERALDNGVTRV